MRRSAAETSYREDFDWRVRALCANDGEYWYPASMVSAAGRAQAADAKRICGRCPSREECLEDAMAVEAGEPQSHRHGIRGGLTGTERAELAKRRRQ